MSNESNPPQDEPVSQLDPNQVAYALEQVRSRQNLLGGALAGLVAAGVGAGLWAGVTLLTGYQIGIIAIAVGFLVGLAVRGVGQGIDTSFGVVGGALAALGCGAGNLLAVCGLVAQQSEMAFVDVLSRLDVGMIQELMVATFSFMDVIFYAIAIYEGYRLSFRPLTSGDLSPLGSAP